MTKLFTALLLCIVSNCLGQKKQPAFEGKYLLDNGLDSVNLRIYKNGRYQETMTSMCSGDDVFRIKGKWLATSDTITLVKYSQKRTGEKIKRYEYRSETRCLYKRDSL